VLIVKRTRRYHRPVVLAAVDPTHQFAKPARLDEEILRRGSAVTRALRGTLHAVHAYMPLPRDMDPKTPWSKKNRAAAIEARAGVRARRAFDRCLRFSRIPRQRRHVVRRLPLEAVPAVARQTGSAIVVLGAISRSGLKGAIIGNTAESLLDDLRCDLLVVKPPRFARRVPRARRGMRFATSLPLVS
jgi:universal stress protein E